MRALFLACLLAVASGCSGPGWVILEGERLDVDRAKVRERVPDRGWVQLELVIEEPNELLHGRAPPWVPIPKDHAGVRISLPAGVSVGEYEIGKDCKLEIQPRRSAVRALLWEDSWVEATRGVVQVERAGEVVRGRFWADTPQGPADGAFRVKRRLG